MDYLSAREYMEQMRQTSLADRLGRVENCAVEYAQKRAVWQLSSLEEQMAQDMHR